MNTDIRNFVQVNIKFHETVALSRSRDTVVLITTNTDANAPQGHLNGVYDSLDAYESAIAAYNATRPVNNIIDDAEHPKLYNYLKCYFDNGGIKVRIIGGFTEPSAETDPSEEQWILNQIVEVDYKEIVIASDCSEDTMRKVMNLSSNTTIMPNAINPSESVKTLSGYKEKIFLSSTDDKTWNDDKLINVKKYPNYIIKFGTAGIEMTVAAFLSRVNINDSRAINDYCYTIEDASMFLEEVNPCVVDDNDDVVALTGKNLNVITTLVNETRNVMGNTIAGFDLMNYYMRIILTQTLTDRVFNVLLSKVKYNQIGINKVVNAITQELNIYKANGYLNTNFIWTDEDLYYSFNNVDYLVCSRNTPLTTGYRFIILPISSLTEEQRSKHVFPPVYVLISDAKGIRQIVINGDLY